jgi:hypothetical protein
MTTMVSVEAETVDSAESADIAQETAPLRSDHLTAEEVRIRTCQRTKTKALRALFVAAFVDLAGAVILQPNHPAMLSNAAGATRNPTWPEGYSHPHAFPANGIPEYTWAVRDRVLEGDPPSQMPSCAPCRHIP